MPTPALSETVRVRNTGTRPFTGRYNGSKFVIDPGSEHFVPFVAACNWFGHPDAMDVDARNKFRTDEVTRLRTKYGVYEASTLHDVPGVKDTPGHPFFNDTRDAFLVLTPDVEVFSIRGEKLTMVIHDPDGSTVNPEVITQAARAQDQDIITHLQTEMAKMKAMIEQLTSGEVAVANAGLISEDGTPLVFPSSGPDTGPSVEEQAARAAAEASGVKTTKSTRVKAPAPSAAVTEDAPDKVKVSS